MRKVLHAILALVVATTSFNGLAGCATKKGPPKVSPDPVIQQYMQERSDLMGQRRRLAATYGLDSPQVAAVDRQIALRDEAIDQRRTHLIEEEHARQQVRQMKLEGSAPASSQPANQPAR
jgi:hypothetical protein